MDHGPAARGPFDRIPAPPVPAQSAPAGSGPAELTPQSGRHGTGRRITGDWAAAGGSLFTWSSGWPLVPILILQAALSARVIRFDTAFQDEALYLWAGHLEWASLLHGGALPQFPAFFSGAPVIYPPLAALVDTVGGLDGARLLSLAFMLGATALLYATSGRLFGKWAAFFSAVLFAIISPTLHLGSFATYDAMALFLVALAAWLVVQAGNRADATLWMAAAGLALALANLTLYPSALFDPVVILLALVVACPPAGGAAGREPGADPAGHRGRAGHGGPAARRQPLLARRGCDH